MIDVFEEDDFEETIIPPSEPDEGSTGNLEPELTPLGLASPDRALQTDDQKSRKTESLEERDQSTHTRVDTPNNLVHSQTASGNEDSLSANDPSE